jgi:hypothetical protein
MKTSVIVRQTRIFIPTARLQHNVHQDVHTLSRVNQLDEERAKKQSLS